MRTICFLIIVLSSTYISNAQTWSPLGVGTNNYVSSLDTFNSNLYVAGYFSSAGGTPVNYFASWNSVTWSNVDNGTDYRIHALFNYNNKLCLGGVFSTAGSLSSVGGIAAWDGTNWSAFGTGMHYYPSMGSGFIYALTEYNNELYAAGHFLTAGSINGNNFTKWNGNNWVSISSSDMSSYIYTLIEYNGELYVGGNFSSTGTINATNLAKWNGSSWSTVGTGTNNSVSCFAIYNGELYVGGNFTIVADATSIAANYIAKWNGTNWSTVGTGMDARVSALAVYNGELYAGGNFTLAGGVSANHIAKWNGTSWSPLGLGINGGVGSMKEFNGDLYVGGSFTTAGGASANNIAKWNNPIGIKELEINYQISIYPNPATDKIYIEQMDKNNKINEITLIDVYGGIYKKTMDDKNEIDTSTLNSGMYILVLNTNKGKVRKKIIVQ
jgi:hypothetical protein